MPLSSIWLVIVVLCGITAAFYSLTGRREVFHVHPTPQMWNASDSTVINGNKFFPLFCQLRKNSRFGAVSTYGSKWDLAYALADVCWEGNEGCHLENCQAVSRKGGSPEDDLFNVVTNSGEALVGGSCSGGLLVLCVVIYILYKCLKDDTSVHPATGNVPQQDARAPCPHYCRNVPSSAPPAYDEVFPMEECGCCMSAPPANSKHQLSDLANDFLNDSVTG